LFTRDIDDAGPYDVVGDVHGCFDALRRLCADLGYDSELRHPSRKLVFVGDLINRGPDSVDVLRAVIRLVGEGRAYRVLGNHDDAMRGWLAGGAEERKLGLERTIDTIEAQPDSGPLWTQIRELFNTAPIVLRLDSGRLVVAHAGIEEKMFGCEDDETRRFILHGDEIGKSPEGKTLRRDWAGDYRGDAFIVYGHTPCTRPEIRNNTVNIDQGAYRGGFLTALRWPERVTLSVPSGFAQVKAPV